MDALRHERHWLDSRPTRMAGGAGGSPDPEIDLLGNTLEEFNRIFGGINWKDTDKIGRVIAEELPPRVSADRAYREFRPGQCAHQARQCARAGGCRSPLRPHRTVSGCRRPCSRRPGLAVPQLRGHSRMAAQCACPFVKKGVMETTAGARYFTTLRQGSRDAQDGEIGYVHLAHSSVKVSAARIAK